MRAHVALVVVLTPVAQAWAQPTVTLDACAFGSAALDRALAQEGATATTVVVACRPDGTATLTITTDAGVRTREVDLRDVPPPLAPRVVALVATALELERPVPAPLPPAPPPDAHPPAPVETTPPTPTLPTMPALPGDARDARGPGATAAERPGLPHGRASVLEGRGARRLALIGRALVRSYDGVPLWGAGVGVGRGPLALGVHAAATSVTHRIGQATPWLVGVDLAVTVACAQGRPITCVGARVDVSRQTVAATSSDPAVMATSIATTAVHGAAELSFTLPIARAEVTATVAVGGGSGLVARANSTPLVSLAGWTVGGAVEVRR